MKTNQIKALNWTSNFSFFLKVLQGQEKVRPATRTTTTSSLMPWKRPLSLSLYLQTPTSTSQCTFTAQSYREKPFKVWIPLSPKVIYLNQFLVWDTGRSYRSHMGWYHASLFIQILDNWITTCTSLTSPRSISLYATVTVYLTRNLPGAESIPLFF